MDARSFGRFLIARLTEHKNVLDNNLKDMKYTLEALKDGHAHRAAGARDITADLIGKMEPLLEEFHKQDGVRAVDGEIV